MLFNQIASYHPNQLSLRLKDWRCDLDPFVVFGTSCWDLLGWRRREICTSRGCVSAPNAPLLPFPGLRKWSGTMELIATLQHNSERYCKSSAGNQLQLLHPNPTPKCRCDPSPLAHQEGEGGVLYAPTSGSGSTVSFEGCTITGNSAVSIRQPIMSRCMPAFGSVQMNAMARARSGRECLTKPE